MNELIELATTIAIIGLLFLIALIVLVSRH